jgi:hypothetical protein
MPRRLRRSPVLPTGDVRRLLLAAALACASAGCTELLGGCTVEYRFAEAEGALTAAPTAGRPPGDSTWISLDQFRGSHDQQTISWRVEAAGFPDSVTAIHLHDARSPAQVLFGIPPRRVATFLALSFEAPTNNYNGAIPFDELFRRLEQGHILLDVHTPGSGLESAALSARLSRTRGRDWHGSCTT